MEGDQPQVADEKPLFGELEPIYEEAMILCGPKLVRLRWMLIDLVGELHESVPDEAAAERLRRVHRQALVEVGSVLSDDLLSELGRLAPCPGPGATPAELRVAEAQLLGWLTGLLGVLADV